MTNKFHHYTFLPLNPMPLVCSVLGLSLFVSGFLFFKHSSTINLLLSISVLALSMMVWFSLFKNEISFFGSDNFNFHTGLKFAFILFIVSEILFFFSFFWSYFHFFLSPLYELGYSWPSFNLAMFSYFNVPMVNTIILLSSGVSVTLAHQMLYSGHKMEFDFYMVSTFVLGFFFTYFQLEEYNSSFFSINDGTFGSVFFVLTGFHGLHVFIGSLFLLCVFFYSLSSDFSSNVSNSFEMSAWYWHFVDVVWLFLFFFFYYLNG